MIFQRASIIQNMFYIILGLAIAIKQQPGMDL